MEVMYNEDCRDVMKGMEPVDLVVTSPPYNVDLGNNKYKHEGYRSYDDNKSHHNYIGWLRSIFQQVYDVLKPGGRVAINIGDGKNGRVPTHVDVSAFMQDIGYLPFTTIIWDKKQIGNRCLPKGEPILTNRGYVNIEDVKTGDQVLTHKRRFRKVTNTYKRDFTGWVYNLKSYSGEEIQVTEGHPLLITPFERRCGKYAPKKRVSPEFYWESPENLDQPPDKISLHNPTNLSGEYYLSIPKYTTEYHASIESFNKRIESITNTSLNYYDTDLFRLFGYYIGDGSTHRYSVRFDFGPNEYDYVQDVVDIADKYGWSTHEISHRKNLNRVEINSHNVLPTIVKKLFGKYSHDKHIHPFLFQAPMDLQKELITGCFRSDGLISDRECCYVTVSKSLAYQIRDILLRLRVGSSVVSKTGNTSTIKGREICGSTSYRVRVYGSHIDTLYKIMGKEINHDFKYRHSKVKVGSYREFYKIRDIKKEWVTNKTVYNLEVEEDHSYVGKTTYHNCAWGSWKSASCPSFPTPFEYILVFAKDSLKLQTEGESDIAKQEFIDWTLALWEFKPETDPQHPAQFPIELPKRLIKMLSYTNATVFDPFAGAGTTLVAAERLGRDCIGAEIDGEYCEIYRRRLLDEIED